MPTSNGRRFKGEKSELFSLDATVLNNDSRVLIPASGAERALHGEYRR
jgi:hypothetical protein